MWRPLQRLAFLWDESQQEAKRSNQWSFTKQADDYEDAYVVKDPEINTTETEKHDNRANEGGGKPCAEKVNVDIDREAPK